MMLLLLMLSQFEPVPEDLVLGQVDCLGLFILQLFPPQFLAQVAEVVVSHVVFIKRIHIVEVLLIAEEAHGVVLFPVDLDFIEVIEHLLE